MTIHRYAKVLLLAPPVGGAVLGVAGLALGVGLILGWGRAAGPSAAGAKPAIAGAGQERANSVQAAGVGAAARVEVAGAQPVLSGQPVLSRVREKSGAGRAGGARVTRDRPTFEKAIFQTPISGDEVGFLNDYMGRPSDDVVHEQRLRRLVSEVAPDAPFHLGVDMPLSSAMESMFEVSNQPVQVRDGRYAMVFGRRSLTGRGRALLWVDMREGIGLGAIFFYPSNGEPTPTLTIFSSQVNQASVKVSELPAAFVEDLTRWAGIVGVPSITTRYFINAAGEKTVLAHEEDYCKGGVGGAGSACEEMNAEAARVDAEAEHFLGETNYASNATLWMVGARSPAR
jgi:hypothetical protein